MKKTTLTLAAGALASLMLAGTAAGDHVPEESNIVKISAALAYGQEVPQPTPGAQQARGSFTGTVKWIGNGAEFTWQLAFRDLTGPATAAHIHVAPRGEAGPVAVPLCSPCTNGQRGMARMDVGTISAMNHGRTYVNIHTAENPDGEIRGQISIWDKMAVTLRPRPVTTRVVGTTSKTRAGFTATIRNVDRNDARMTWRLEWFALTGKPTSAGIHLGERGKVGRMIFFICGNKERPCRNERGRTDRLSLAQAQALMAGDLYVLVRTARNPKGEVRAQLRKAQLLLRTS